jgi:fructose-1,6-bisphosphatase II
MLLGIGGSPEGVLSACALKCMNGEIQARLHPRNEEEEAEAGKLGLPLGKVLMLDDLVGGKDIFFSVTGITDGELVDGIKYYGTGCRTHSLVMRSQTGTVREIIARHSWDKLMDLSKIKYDLDHSRK